MIPWNKNNILLDLFFHQLKNLHCIHNLLAGVGENHNFNDHGFIEIDVLRSSSGRDQLAVNIDLSIGAAGQGNKVY